MPTPTKYLLLFALSILNFGHVEGQSDSLLVHKYLKKYLEVEYIDNDLSKIYADSSLFYALRSKHPELIGKAFQYQGWYFENTSKFFKAREMFLKSLEQFQKTGKKQLIADAYGNIGNVFLDIEDYTKSLEYQLLSLRLNEEILQENPTGKKRRLALEGKTYALHNIASIYGEVGMNRKALEYERKSLKSEIDAGNRTGEAISCNSLGKMFKSLDQPDSASYYFKRAIEIYNEVGDYPVGKAAAYVSYSTLDGADLSDDEIKEMLLEAKHIYNQLQDKEGLINVNIAYAVIFFDELSVDSLSKIIDRVEVAINDLNLGGVYPDFLKLKSSYFTRIGKYSEANRILNDFISLLEEQDFEERSQELLEDDIKYEIQKKVINDSLELEKAHAIERAIDQQKINEQRKLISLGVIGGLLLFGLLIVLYVANRRRKRTNVLLAEKNDLIRKQKNIVDIRNREISDSIGYAKRLQSAILPMLNEFKNYFADSFVFYRPKDIVSGDFYWLDQIDNLVFVAVADCTGHGVPGAMVSVVCNSALNRSIHEFRLKSPNSILEKTRELVIETFSKSTESVDDGMDIALCVLDRDSNRLLFAGANNSLWIVRSSSKQGIEANRVTESEGCVLYELRGDKQPIGNYPRRQPFTVQSVQLEKNDRLYMTTDGFVDQFGGERGKKYQVSQLKNLLLKNADMPVSNQYKLIQNEFENWRGKEEQVDDVCVMGLLID